jgi:small-conductance mechanosensitive channel
LLIGFIRDVNRLGFEHILIWGQIVVAILAVLTGMAINYLVRKKLHLTKIKGQGGVQRIIFPLSAFTIISIVNVSLQKIYPNLRFLDFINALLFALAVIRLMVYMMQVAFPNRVKDGRWLSTTIWIIFALYATGLAGFLQAGLDDVAFQYGKTRISLWNIIEATFVVAVTLLVSLSLSHLIENRLMRSTSGDMSMKVIIAGW